MAHYYEYAVLRVVPDRRRGECVNVGLVIFNESGVDVRLTPSLAKVSALNGKIDLEELRDLPRLIAEWVEKAPNNCARHSLLANLGIASVSDLGKIEVKSQKLYEERVGYLMRSLVTPVSGINSKQAVTKIKTALRAKFRRNGILGSENNDIAKHLVVPDYPIDEDEGLFADFVVKNGAYRVTETADLRATSTSNLGRVRVASFAAIKLDKARQAFGHNTKRFVIYASRKDAPAHSINLLGDYSDHIFHLDSHSDMANYMELIMEAASHTRALGPKEKARELK